MHKFFVLVCEDKEYARQLITYHDSPVTFNNPDGIFKPDVKNFASKAQQDAY